MADLVPLTSVGLYKYDFMARILFCHLGLHKSDDVTGKGSYALIKDFLTFVPGLP